jgi:hypothetical protein
VPVEPVVPQVSAVPRRLRLICACTSIAIVAVMTVVAILLKSSTTGVVAFRTADQIAMVILGLALGAAVLWVSRPRMDADTAGIRVRNIVGTYELPWSVVQAVRFDQHSPWATLRLTDGEEVAVLAVQAADGERTVQAVQALRRLFAAAVPPDAAPPKTPLLYE